MQEETKVDKDYIEAFNQGYELSKELGLKPDILKDLAAGNHRMQAMQDGMEQYSKDLIEKRKEKTQDIIPPFDMDSMDSSPIDLTPEQENKDKGKGLDM